MNTCGIKANENLTDIILTQLRRDLNILSFFRISRLNCNGPLITMDSKFKLRQEFNNNPEGNDEASDQIQLL